MKARVRFGADLSQESLELLAECAAAAGREVDRVRPVGVVEVVDVAPVAELVRLLLPLVQPPLDVLTDGCRLAGAGHPRDEDVVPRLVDPQPELERSHRPVLTHELGQRRDLVGAVEGEGVGVEGGAQALGRDLPIGVGHYSKIQRSMSRW